MYSNDVILTDSCNRLKRQYLDFPIKVYTLIDRKNKGTKLCCTSLFISDFFTKQNQDLLTHQFALFTSFYTVIKPIIHFTDKRF